jgi:hypothetical protein
MERDRISDEVRYVVERQHVGSIFPTKILELNRDVYLNDGANVEGAIYAHSLYVRGGHISVSRSIFSKHSLKISLAEEGFINFNASVAAVKSLYVEDNTNSNYVRIRGDVHIENANLKRVIVYGNIYGRSINLENSAVLGGVYATDKITSKRSLLGTFLGDHVYLKDGTTLWLPNGIGVDTLKLSGTVKCFTFSLPKVFTELVKGKMAEIPDEPLPLTQGDVSVLSGALLAGDAESPKGPARLAGVDSFHYLSLGPRLYHAEGAFKSQGLNLKVHTLLSNVPGISGRDLEDRLQLFDNAIWKFLDSKKRG